MNSITCLRTKKDVSPSLEIIELETEPVMSMSNQSYTQGAPERRRGARGMIEE
jgi:hypothetical protein